MLKILLKQQLRQLYSIYFYNKRKGTLRSKAGIAGYILLFITLFLCIASLFMVTAIQLGDALLKPGFMAGNDLDWLYFGILAVMAFAVGLFGSVFSTYSALYNARDNELLLSMPIKPRDILLSRLIGVYISSVIYCSSVWIPAVLNYWFTKFPDILSIVNSIGLMFLIPMVVTAAASALGWVIAVIASRMRRKNLVTAVAAIVGFSAYYYICFNMDRFLNRLVEYALLLSNNLSPGVYFIRKIGLAACGDPIAMVLAFAIGAGALGICISVMTSTYIGVITSSKGAVKNVYKEKAAKVRSARSALRWKEFKRFTGSPTYFLNCGLGIGFMPVLAILCVFNREYVLRTAEFAESMAGPIPGFIPMLTATAGCGLAAMGCISAPSVSLEGKHLWIVRSMPALGRDALQAKLDLHVIMNAVPLTFFTAVCCASLGCSVLETAGVLACCLGFAVLNGCMGLAVNLKHYNLEWANEAAPVKQSLSVFITLMGGLVLSAAVMIVYVPVMNIISPALYLALCAALFAGVSLVLQRWILTKGAEIFENL